jgi:hypothetical protein
MSVLEVEAEPQLSRSFTKRYTELLLLAVTVAFGSQ